VLLLFLNGEDYMNVSIVIPAYNEEKRIYRTLAAYSHFFKEVAQQDALTCEFVVVLNGCTDATKTVVQAAADAWGSIVLVDLGAQAGKGLAIKVGFLNALQRPNDYIGFVDADMATLPEYFFDLIGYVKQCDGVIASRYMPGATVYPPRQKYKRWGSRLIYEPLIRLLFGISYYDYQCGAKLFTREVIEAVAPELTVKQWAFDVELLYRCKRHAFFIKEIPTVWYDQADSKLSLRAGLRMLGALIKLRFRL
jgi:glycosyltransferase involved in cell wall biosynthesis